MQEVANYETGIIQRIRNYFIPHEDMSLPHRTRRTQLRIEDKLLNDARLHVRHSLKQRTQLRLFFDCLTRSNGRSTYKRMRGLTVYLDCPTPEQAELAIEAILSFAASLDGKWLAPAEQAQSTQATDTAMLREHSVNAVNETNEPASDSQAIGTQSASEETKAAGDSLQDGEAQAFSGS